MPQIVMRCPVCGKGLLAKTGDTVTSEVITTNKKTCTGCGKTLEIKVRVTVEEVKAEGAKK